MYVCNCVCDSSFEEENFKYELVQCVSSVPGLSLCVLLRYRCRLVRQPVRERVCVFV